MPNTIYLNTKQDPIEDEYLHRLVAMVRRDIPQDANIQSGYCVEYNGRLYHCFAIKDGSMLTLKVKDLAALKLCVPAFSEEEIYQKLDTYPRLLLTEKRVASIQNPIPPSLGIAPIQQSIEPAIPLAQPEVPPIQERISDPIELYGITFILSQEIQNGIAGKRSDDHQVTRELLKLCLKKKTKTFRKASQTDEDSFSLYFMVHRGTSSRVLKLIVRKHRGFNNFLLLTAFYPTQNVLKHNLNLTDVALSNWEKQICQVTLN